MALIGTKVTALQRIWQRCRNMVRAHIIELRFRPSLNSVFLLTQPDGSRVEHATIGRWGEDLAAKWLKKNGRKILYRNFRASGGGEVDIVCRHGKTLTFVEVKTRTYEGPDRPAMAVNEAKEKLILRGAQAWLRMLDDSKPIPRRCDIVEVLLKDGEKPKVTIIEGAFRIWDREKRNHDDWE